MKRLKLNTWSLGNTFGNASEKAKTISIDKETEVEFEFNNVTCIVDKNTDLKLLWKDYSNAHLMEWREVDGKMNYTEEVLSEMKKRQDVSDKKQDQYRKERDEKDNKQKNDYLRNTKDVEIQLKDESGWNECKKINSDPYGKCAVDYAESWAKLMQVQISHGKKLIDIAEKTSGQLNFYGITGYMYGAAVSMLSQYWIHGEELRKWHNKEYNHEGEGVVNPAILTLNV